MATKTINVEKAPTQAVKPYKGTAMEGPIASWYTKIRERDPQHRAICQQIRDALPGGGRILEVAPGPGYLAIELAKDAGFQVVGLDISKSFVQIAQAKARDAGVAVDFRHGNASDMQFEASIFDFIVCVAAFKNFSEPVKAIAEMYRVLRPGGQALISDLRGDASQADINTLVDDMEINALSKLMTRWTFKHVLLKNAYTAAEIRQMVAGTGFEGAEIREDNVSLEIWLRK
jgi:ubiquinone/menaquinone biosynthesis C-methylase UbiE